MSAAGNGFRTVGRAVARPVRGVAAASGRRPRAALVSLGVLVVLLGVLSGFFYQQQHGYDVVEDRRQAALQTAKQQAEALLSYNYATLEQELAQEKAALTGQFKKDYVTLVQDLLAPAARKQQLTIQAQVRAASVMSASPERVEVLLFMNQSIASKSGSRPQQAGSRVQMTLNRIDDRWLVSKLQPV